MRIIETISVWFTLVVTGQVQGANQYGDGDVPPSKLNPSLSCIIFSEDGCRGTCGIISRLYGCEVKPYCRKGMYCECGEIYHFPKRDVPGDEFGNLPFNELWNFRFQNSPQSTSLQNAIKKDNEMRNFALPLLRDPHTTGEEIKAALNERYPQLKQVRELPSIDRGEKNHLESTGNNLEYDNLGEYFEEIFQSWKNKAREKAEECKYKRRIMNLLNNVKDEDELRSVMRQVVMSGNDKLYNFVDSYLRKRQFRFDNASLLQPRRGRYGRPGCRRSGHRNRLNAEDAESDLSPWDGGRYRRRPIKKTVILRKGEKPVIVEADEDEIIEVTVINELLDGSNGNGNGKTPVSSNVPQNIGKPPEIQMPQKPTAPTSSSITIPANDLSYTNNQDLTSTPATWPAPVYSQLDGPTEVKNNPAKSVSPLINNPSVYNDDTIPAQPNIYSNPLQSQNSKTFNSFSPTSFLPQATASPLPTAPNFSLDNVSNPAAKLPSEYISQSISPPGMPWLSAPYYIPTSTDQLAQATSNGLPTTIPNSSPSSYQNQVPSWMRYIPGYGSNYMSGPDRSVMDFVNGYIPSPVLPYVYGSVPSQPNSGYTWNTTPWIGPAAGTHTQRMPNNLPTGMASSNQPFDNSVKVSQSAPADQPYSYSFSYSNGDNSGHSDSNSNSAGSVPGRYNTNRPLNQPEITSASPINIPNPTKSITDAASNYMQQGMSNWYPGKITETISERLPSGVSQPSSILNASMEPLKANIPAMSIDEIQNLRTAASQTMNENGSPLSLITNLQDMVPGTDRMPTYLPETQSEILPGSVSSNFNYNMMNQEVPLSSTIFQNTPELISQPSTPSIPFSENVERNNENRDVLSGSSSQLTGSVAGEEDRRDAASSGTVKNDISLPNSNKRNKSMYYIVVDGDDDEHQGIEKNLQTAFKNISPSFFMPPNFPIPMGT